jgi:hypothetical protein
MVADAAQKAIDPLHVARIANTHTYKPLLDKEVQLSPQKKTVYGSIRTFETCLGAFAVLLFGSCVMFE